MLNPDTLAIYMDCGTSDEYYCYPMHTALAESLDALGIPYEFQPYAGSHQNMLQTRFAIAFVFLDSVMQTGIQEFDDPIPYNDIGMMTTIQSGPLQVPKDKICKIFDISDRRVFALNPAPGIYFMEVDGEVIQKVIKIR